MKMKIVATGAFAENCYLIISESGELLIFDPGADADLIISVAKPLRPKSTRIILTHAHIDHFSAAGDVAAAMGVESVEVSPEDLPLYRSSDSSLLPYYPMPDNLPAGREIAAIPGVQIIPLPGHTPGGRGFYFAETETPFLLSGDSLFRCAIGRTDFPGGNYQALVDAIRENLLTLPDEVKVYPGHGPATTIGYERANNPYLT